MDWWRFAKFVGIGLLVVLAGEFLLQVLVEQSLRGYATTLFSYVVLLCIAYAAGNVFDRMPLSDFLYFLVFASLGLLIEWFLLGNAPWINPYANHAGMFSWWGAVFLVPRIFTSPDEELLRGVRRRIAITLLVYSVVLLAVTIPTDQDARVFLGAIILTISFLALNFSYTGYFTRKGGWARAYYAVWALLLVLGIAQFFLVT